MPFQTVHSICVPFNRRKAIAVVAGALAFGLIAGCARTAPGSFTRAGDPSVSPATAANASSAPTPLIPLVAGGGCDKCRDTLLPGRVVPLPDTAYTIWSDLPEVFCSTGLLYATVDTLPPDPNGNPPEPMRRQIRDDSFTGIDGSFDVFLFHTIYGCGDPAPRRIVLYVRNEGSHSVILQPQQIIVTDGLIGTVHEMEGGLGRRAMEDDWDVMIPSVDVPSGTGAVVAWSKQFGMKEDGPDSSRSVNCFGRVRVRVDNRRGANASPNLVAYLVAIDGAPIEESAARAEALLGQSAVSGEKHIDFTTRPSGCQVRRATGLFRSFEWRNDPMVLDADALTATGVVFPMALWKYVTPGCPAARQTADLLLHPEYTRTDTIGNYMVDYRVRLRLINRNATSPRTVDVRFGKSDADIGLAWRVATGGTSTNTFGASAPDAAVDAAVDAQPVRTGWAGPKQAGMTRSFLESDGGPIKLAPGEVREVALRFMVLGNSSLPFDVRVEPVAE